MSLAKRLKEAREDKVWKKVDLKKAAKLRSASTLTELENGDITESPQLPAIADALGVEIMWLKYGKGPKHRPAAKTVQLSEDALQIALAVNAKSPEYQRAILDLVTVDAIKDEGAALSETPILVEDNRLSSRSPEEQPDDQDRSLPAQHVTRPQK